MSTANGVVTRGTTNGNQRGSSESRRRRRTWLVLTYRANVDLHPQFNGRGELIDAHVVLFGQGQPACRCYRCGRLLIDAPGLNGLPSPWTVTVDRIIPGCRGGTYRRNNIRPACRDCNSETGGATRSKR